MAYEHEVRLTREQKAYRAKLQAYMKDLGQTENGRAMREYLGFMLYALRLGNDEAEGATLLRNQGGIAVCLQLMEDLKPPALDTVKKDTDLRTPEERMASPDAGY